jgi:drug/metabolite transporter (DMT)-like permease
MIGWGLADFFAKVSIDDIGELPSLAWGHLVGTIVLGILTLARAFGASDIHYGHVTVGVVASLIFFGFLQAIVYFLLYKGFAVGQVAVLSPTFASFSGIVALVSILFLGESVTVGKLLALAAVFAGVMLLSAAPAEGEQVRFFGAPGVNIVLAATLLAAGWTLGWVHLVYGRDPISFAFFMYSAMTLVLFGIAKQQKVSLTRLPRRTWIPLVAIGLGEAGAYAALSWGYSSTSLTSIVVLLSGAFSLPTILLARVFLGERLQRLAVVGVAAVIVGTGILAVVG